MTAPAPHMRICDCGARICAVIERAFALGGQPAEPDAVGSRLSRTPWAGG
ncbi:MAG: hypothetical protein HLUCCA09_02205 [Rhodobacteraceae bacterium HLUCCA09]|nr:MAG: hypothetical protein HLUCCA09_02205 [Rhodobacteraceae bacterium HLUCCA09]